jgi:enamine deaminase RidA (YjgF/YER057c/UK114 family)
MSTKHNPDSVAPPIAAYSHGVEVPPEARWLYVSGQVAIAPDGTVPEGIEAQADQVFRNILNVLASAGMGAEHLVRINTYLTEADDMAGFRKVRDEYVGEHAPASTMIVIDALARPEFRIEIEAVAAKAD